MTQRVFAILGVIWVFIALPLTEFIGANEGWRAVVKPLLLQSTYGRDLFFAAVFYLPLICGAVAWWRTTRNSNAQD